MRHVDGQVVVEAAHGQVLEQADDVVHVLLVDPADLSLGDEGVDGGDRVLVDLDPFADVDVVVHLHDVEKDVEVVDERTGGHLGIGGRPDVGDRVRAGGDCRFTGRVGLTG